MAVGAVIVSGHNQGNIWKDRSQFLLNFVFGGGNQRDFQVHKAISMPLKSQCAWKYAWAFSSYICLVKIYDTSLEHPSPRFDAQLSLSPVKLPLTPSPVWQHSQSCLGPLNFHTFISTFLPILLTLPHHLLKASLSRSSGSPTLITLKPLWQTPVRQEQFHKTLSSARQSHQRDSFLWKEPLSLPGTAC